MNCYGHISIFSKIITYLSGPLCNLFFALIFYFTKIKIELVQINLILGILNLFPIIPLDGGRILKEIVKKIYGHKTASIFMIEFTKFNLIIISLVYSVAILKLKNVAVLFLILYMWWLYLIEEKRTQTLKRVYGIIEKSIEKKIV
ncbi:MAG: site-2 protease family protein [Clostridia bacterium]|nr:site-2 protease family protein [Clostridia bacterium]